MGTVAGKAIVLAFAAVLVAAFVIVVAYKVQEAGEPPSWMRFTSLEASPGAAPSAQGPEAGSEGGSDDANATVFRLDFRAVHAAYFLEDHLDTAASQGTSIEQVRLRVESMRDTLQALTGHAGPAWTVEWEGNRILVETGSGAVPDLGDSG